MAASVLGHLLFRLLASIFRTSLIQALMASFPPMSRLFLVSTISRWSRPGSLLEMLSGELSKATFVARQEGGRSWKERLQRDRDHGVRSAHLWTRLFDAWVPSSTLSARGQLVAPRSPLRCSRLKVAFFRELRLADTSVEDFDQVCEFVPLIRAFAQYHG